MATPYTPGSKPENRDVLTVGCWAEADGGKSLVLVEVWPEIEHIVRKYEKTRHVRALPAKPVADLNRELGLNQFSGPSQSKHRRIASQPQQAQDVDNGGNVVSLPNNSSNAA